MLFLNVLGLLYDVEGNLVSYTGYEDGGVGWRKGSTQMAKPEALKAIVKHIDTPRDVSK